MRYGHSDRMRIVWLHIAAMMSSPNSEHLRSVAPSIRRWALEVIDFSPGRFEWLLGSLTLAGKQPVALEIVTRAGDAHAPFIIGREERERGLRWVPFR